MRNWRRVLAILIFDRCALDAIPTVILDSIPCVGDLELYFFDEKYLKQRLGAYQIRQELWSPIYLSLQKRVWKFQKE